MSRANTDNWLGERYHLLRQLGCGGMASVWEADDAKLKRRVAVKVLAGRHAGRRDAQARFERESMAVAKLRSPHIVQVYDYGIENDRPFMVMELLTGETLSERLRKVRRLELPQVVALARDLGKALATAHQAGIVHRDLKPGNIFLVRDHGDEIAKVFDFGISKALEPLGGSSLTHDAIVGTPSFMSPEQMHDSSEVDARTDLWSFGVILYRACTGRLPFTGPNLGRVIGAVVKAPVPSVRAAGTEHLPAELDGFFERALAKEPHGRFTNALEMAEAFTALAAPVPRRMLPMVPPPEKPSGHATPPPPERRRATPPPPPKRRRPPPLPHLEELDSRPPLDDEPPTELRAPLKREEEITMSLGRSPASEGPRAALVALAALLLSTGIAVTLAQSRDSAPEPMVAQAISPPRVEVPAPAPTPSASASAKPRRIVPVPISAPVSVPREVIPPVEQKKPARDLFEEPW